MNRKTIIYILHHFNNKHQKDAFRVVALFGSYARDTEDIFSDIDLTYTIDYNIFFKDDAFAKLNEIEKLKKELEYKFHKKVDLIPANTKNNLLQKSILEEQIAI